MEAIVISSRAKLLYLLTISIVLFISGDIRLVGSLLLLQSVLWLLSGLPLRALIPMTRRLAIFFFFIMTAYVFFPVGIRETSEPIIFLIGSWTLELSTTGFFMALLMCARVWVLMIASLWVQRSCKPGAMVQGMMALKTPQFLAVALETTLELLAGESEKRPGSGGGKGKGEGQGRRGKKRSRVVVRFDQMRRGDFSFFYDLIEHSLQRAEKHIHKTANLNAEQARDVAIIAGISVAIMGLKMFQLMPALPVAPGHKNLLIIPLFLLASTMTHSRFGGLWTGLTVGIVNFMLGFGKFGILEVFQFMIPGLLADILLPIVRGIGWWRLFHLVLIGAVLGFSRFIANILVIMLAGAPAAAFFIYLPMLVSQLLFGMLSVIVSSPLLIWASDRKTDTEQNKKDQNIDKEEC